MAPKTEKAPSPTRRAKRAIQIVYVGFAAWFIVFSTWQVYRQVTGGPVGASVGANCAFALKSFEESVDQGLARAARERSPGKADEIFEDTVITPLESVNTHCSAAADHDAYIAAMRYREAAELTIDQQHSNLANLRRALDARLPP
ncbi:MAG TPA: hypothetical protein VGI39_42540 [Polyangiaceae bacterium]